MSELFDVLVPKLRSRFGDRGLRLEQGPRCHVVFPAAHPVVGDLVLYDDGDEVTVYFGKFTHSHYGPLKYGSGSRDLEGSLASLMDDVEALLADQIVMWGSHSGGGGIFRRDDKLRLKRDTGEQHYVWSGPLSKPSDG